MHVKSEVELRRARPSDLNRICEIERACFSDPWPQSAFAGEVDSEVPMWVAVCDGLLVGYLCRFPGVDESHISNLAVHPDYRRRGIGRRLVEECIRDAAACRLQWVYLDVRPSNTAARALYGELGFVEIYRRPRYYIRPPEDGLVLGRQISPADVGPQP